MSERDAREIVSRLDVALEDAGTAYSSFERTDGTWEVAVYPDEASVDFTRDILDQIDVGTGFAASPLPDENWVARSLQHLAPVRAGRFLVHGSHDRAAVRRSDISIEIDTGEAFGTGHHETTTGCLIAIERILRRTRPNGALDLGTGSGVLAIALAKRGTPRTIATDIDATAVRTARNNAIVNDTAPRIVFVRANGLQNPTIQAGQPYDLVVANILAEPLRVLAQPIATVLAPNGVTILSGILDRQVRSVLNAYRRYGLVPIDTISLRGWSTLTLQRRTPTGR